MSDWKQVGDGHIDFASLYTSKSVTPKHFHNGDRSQLYFSPSPRKSEGLDLNQNFCSQENIDQRVSYLNEELTVLGFPSLFHDVSDTFDVVRLVNVTNELLQKYQGSRRVCEEMENRQHKTDSDKNYLQAAQARLKESLEQSHRDSTQLKEKERQLLNKIKSLALKLKNEKEEVKRLQSVVQHRTMQFKHELKKKERETNKLKDRMHKLLTDKNQERRIGMDILNALQRADGRRSTWKTHGSNKHEEEMYRLLISSYEERQKQIMIENNDLRQSLADMQRELVALLNGQASPCKADQSNVLNDVSLCSDDDDLSLSPSTPDDFDDLSEGHFQMPYEMVRDGIHKSLKEKWTLLKERIRKIEKQQDSKNTPILSNGITPDVNRTYSKTPKTSDGGKNEVEGLKKQITKYKDIIQQQEQLIQQTFQQSPSGSKDKFYLDEDFIEDKENLAREKQMLYHQKTNFEEERKHITEAAIKLSREKKAFEEEKAAVLSKQFMQMTPFVRPGARRSSGSPSLISASPVFAAAPNKSGDTKVRTPATSELYRSLGLRYRDDQETMSSAHSTSRQSLTSSHGGSSTKLNGSNRSSPASLSRVNEHMANIKTALFNRKTDSPDGQHHSSSED